ncbi:hypothetical protein PS1_037817 [Malus domestica]
METTNSEETVTEYVSDWADLTQERLINILGRLTPEQRWIGLMLVCKSWLSMCKELYLNSNTPKAVTLRRYLLHHLQQP